MDTSIPHRAYVWVKERTRSSVNAEPPANSRETMQMQEQWANSNRDPRGELTRRKNYFLAVNLFHSRTPMEDHKFTTQFSDFFIEENENLLSSKTIFTKSSFSASRTPHILNFTTEHILYFFLLKRDGPRFAIRLPHWYHGGTRTSSMLTYIQNPGCSKWHSLLGRNLLCVS